MRWANPAAVWRGVQQTGTPGGTWILMSSSLGSLECGAKHGVSMERGRFRSFSGMVQTPPTFGLEWENVKMWLARGWMGKY